MFNLTRGQDKFALAKEEIYSDNVESEDDFRNDPDYISLAELGSKVKEGLHPKKKRAKKGTLEWKCRRCKDVVFNSKRLLRQHRIKAHPPDEHVDLQYNYTCLDGVYTCNTCDCDFESKAEVEVHVLEHAEKLKCKVCNAAFTKLYELCLHSQVHNDEGWFQCDICAYKTKARSALLTHVNQFHLGKLRYSCELCTKKFADIFMYKEHVEWHRTGQLFECIVCNRKFEYSRYLVLHQRRNHTAHIEGVILPNQCPICKKSFAKSDTVAKHMKQHDEKGKMIHLCDLCGNGYKTKTKLKDHYRIHTGEKPYKCKDCSKSFSQRYYLTLHERMHTGVKPYTCEYCGKSFSQVTPLQVHKRSHTGEKPFTCMQCERGFTSRGNLNTHLKRCSLD